VHIVSSLFVFVFDPVLVGLIDSAEAWFELAFIEQQEENDVPLARSNVGWELSRGSFGTVCSPRCRISCRALLRDDSCCCSVWIP
jgi:hypothetical protein